MPHVKTHPFGPGQYESLVLKTWISKVEGSSFNRRERVTGRLEGVYTIYCGEGNEHDFEIKEDISAWNTEVLVGEIGLESDAFLLFEIHNFINKVDAIYEIADRLMNNALEDWFDPCEATEL